jgi:hypothetical protein
VKRKVVVLESCAADNLIRNGIQFQLFHRYNLAIQQGFLYKLGQILHARLRMNCSALNAHLFIRNHIESPNCICGITETVSHFLQNKD